MKFTGERMIPEYNEGQEIYLEHMTRYIFASQFVKNKVVLDIACGSGYGSNYLLKSGAKKVFGVDISEETISYCKEKYTDKELGFLVGDVKKIPIEDKSIDVVVSFETIEHVNEEDQKIFLKEVKRVLTPEGIFIVSTPNSLVYGKGNKFHLKELDPEEFAYILKKNFKNTELFYQDNVESSYVYSQEVLEKVNDKLEISKKIDTIKAIDSMYLISVCGDFDLEEIKGYNSLSNIKPRIKYMNLVRDVQESKDKEIELKNIELSSRIEEISNKNRELEEKDKEVKMKELNIIQKDQDILNKSKEIESKNNELSLVYSSRAWRLIVLTRKILDIIIPKGSYRRKIAGHMFRFSKKVFEFIKKATRFYLSFVFLLKKGIIVLKKEGLVILSKKVLKFLLHKKTATPNTTNSESVFFVKKPLMFNNEIKAENIAVVVHLYYTELWSDIVEKLKNIPYEYTLIVSLTENHFQQSDIDKIKKYKPDAKIVVFANKGMDILPFLKCLKYVNKNTKYVLKIQSKKSLHAPDVGSRWFKDMLEHVLPKKEEVDLILHNLEYTDIGMIGGSIVDGCDRTFLRGEEREPKVDQKFMDTIYEYFNEEESDFRWISGTIFWTRFDLVSKLAEDSFIELVEKYQPNGYSKDDTLVHGIERYFGKIVYDSGKIISLNPIPRYSKNYITLIPEKGDILPKKDIYLFFHICCMGNYINVVDELIDSLIKSGLYEKSKKVFFSILGNPSNEFTKKINSLEKFELIYKSEKLEEFEYPTLFYLQNFCVTNDAYVMYFHTKGVSNPLDEDKNIWRKQLIQKTIYEHEKCVSFLNKGCDVSGCGWKEHPYDQSVSLDYSTWTHSHFSGNFWWAQSTYIRLLPDIKKAEIDYRKVATPKHVLPPDRDIYRVLCEMFIGMKENIKIGVNGDLNKEYSPLTGEKTKENEKKNIVFISHDNSMTGAPKIVFEVAESLMKNPKNNVILLCSDIKENKSLKNRESFMRMDSLYNVPVVYCNVTDKNVISDFIKKYKPDILYVNTVAVWRWIKNAIENNIPYIFHVHEKMEAIKALTSGCGNLFSQIEGNKVISVSISQKIDLKEIGVKTPVLINEFINTKDASVLKNKKEPLPKGMDLEKPIIILIGSVSLRKGTDVFIDTARLMPDFQFLCIGGVYEDDIIKDTPTNFFYIPQTYNIYYYLSISSLFTLTSREEPFSLIVLDSLYLNKPVVCFKEGVGTADILSSLGYVLPGKVNTKDLVSFIKNFDFKSQKKTTSDIIKNHYSQLSQIPKIEDLINKISSGIIYYKGVESFLGKVGIEIGGPSGVFSTLLPVYPIAQKIDGVNFSEKTLWDSRHAGKNSYSYFDNKKGDQYTLEASDLTDIDDSSYDFLLASHCLEHVANPIKTVKEWARVVKPDGFMVVIVPNKELCFDHNRDFVSFEHLFSDYVNDVGEDDLTHLDEILEKHDLSMDLPAGTKEQFKERSLQNFSNRGLHQHVFSRDNIEEIFSFLGITLENIFIDGINIVCIGRVSAYKKIFNKENE